MLPRPPDIAWPLTPAVRVDGLAAGRLVLDIADGRPVRLFSYPGITGLAGAGWWAGLQQEWNVCAAGPFRAVLDCADVPGLVLAALRAGCTDIAFTPRPDSPDSVNRRLTSLTEAHGARLHPGSHPVTEVRWPRNRDATLRQYLDQILDFKQM